MDTSKQTGSLFFWAALLACVGVAAFVYFSDVLSFWFALMLGLVTFVAPLGGSLFVYRGRLRRFALGLAVVTSLCGFILLVDMLATQSTFGRACQDVGGHAEYWADYAYVCTGLPESETFDVPLISGSVISGIAFYLYVAVALLSVLHLPILGWRLVKKKL